MSVCIRCSKLHNMIITKLLGTYGKLFKHNNSLLDYHFGIFIQLLPNLESNFHLKL